MMDSETAASRGGEKSCIPLPANAGPRPYRCEICQRSFREVATLRKHEQLHRADRPYVCNTCGKSFLWSSNLKVHERVHTGERPYKCKICHRCFTQSNDLRRHERNVHMRGKLYSYKTPSGRPLPPPAPTAPGHMNLAAYQAFALQQRAILQHALTYETLMQNAGGAGVSASSYIHREQLSQALARKDSEVTTISTSTAAGSNGQLQNGRDERSLSLEQVTPPPGDQGKFERSDSNMTTSNLEKSRGRHSPANSRYSPTSSKIHSPNALSSTTYGIANGHHRPSAESPVSLKEERPPSHESHHSAPHLDYSKYYASYAEHHAKLNDLPHIYRSAFNMAPNSAIDSVMDLSINKSMSSLESEDGELEWKARNSSALSSKSPDSESESDSKRDVTTTSDTPTVDSGIHHCPHCNILFHDFTMFNLHQSLHSPVDEDPFLCPSCLKRCADRVEFMFHIVWHVKYPHTIPKYQSFKETYLMADAEAEVADVEPENDNDTPIESS